MKRDDLIMTDLDAKRGQLRIEKKISFSFWEMLSMVHTKHFSFCRSSEIDSRNRKLKRSSHVREYTDEIITAWRGGTTMVTQNALCTIDNEIPAK